MFIMRLIIFINGQLSERCVCIIQWINFLKQKQIKNSHFQTLKKKLFSVLKKTAKSNQSIFSNKNSLKTETKAFFCIKDNRNLRY